MTDEEKGGSDWIQDGKDSREQLICRNLKLIAGVARRYIGRGVSYSDLVQEGSLGLIRAVDKYDPMLGYRFSTYATWWIRQAVRRAIVEQGRPIRLPEHLANLLYQLRREQARIEMQGEVATPKLIADCLGIDESKVINALKHSEVVLSMDKPMTEDGSNLGEVTSGEEEAHRQAIENFRGNVIREVVDGLPDKQKQVITLRYGLDSGQPRTLQEVAEILDLSRERIRQIEAKALKGLRKPEKSTNLGVYLEN